MKRWLVRTMLSAALLAGALGVAAPAQAAPAAAGGNNDFSCRPTSAHPDPVVLLHGAFANNQLDLSHLQADLATQGYCTFSLTYGAYPELPLIGGLGPIAHSSAQIAAFVEQVRAATGAAKVDVVGHSEGGFLSLYLAKMQGIASEINRVVAIAPPSHGADSASVFILAELLLPGGRSTLDKILSTVGLPVLADTLPGGSAMTALNSGPIAQPGIAYTVITSRFDEIVTPPGPTSFVNEPGVTNEWVQDSCPLDLVGHVGEASDRNVWHLVGNALDPAHATPISVCAIGLPV